MWTFPPRAIHLYYHCLEMVLCQLCICISNSFCSAICSTDIKLLRSPSTAQSSPVTQKQKRKEKISLPFEFTVSPVIHIQYFLYWHEHGNLVSKFSVITKGLKSNTICNSYAQRQNNYWVKLGFKVVNSHFAVFNWVKKTFLLTRITITCNLRFLVLFLFIQVHIW